MDAMILTRTQIIPPQYPYTSDLAYNTTLQVFPGLGQTNLMPDALVKTNITFKDRWRRKMRTIKLDNMIGFHDQMWSPREYNKTITAWRRGNARLTSTTNDTYSVV